LFLLKQQNRQTATVGEREREKERKREREREMMSQVKREPLQMIPQHGLAEST
jgi:hypothetical protein